MSISFGMDTALSGLSASQRALEVTGHNVSNLGTAGYSRQSVVLSSYHTRSYGNWKIEMGVDIEQIRQIRFTFIDNIYRSEVNALGYWDARGRAVKDVEAILGEPMTLGFQNSLNNFWDAWQELSKAPESLTIRALVKQRSDALIRSLNHVGEQLTKLQKDLNDEIRTRIDEVNNITAQIASLNVKIMSAEAAGNLPNDYYDERNVLADRLSQLVKAETWIGSEGNMDIIVDGYFLVSKGIQTRIIAAPNDDLSHFYTPKVEGINMPIDLGQGEIKGLIEAKGAVDGSKGSFDNGTPNTTADITFAIDIANNTDANLANIKANIADMVSDLEKRGINYNLRLILFGDGSPITITNWGKDAAGLAAAIPATASADGGYDFQDIVDAVTGAVPFMPEANRYLTVFTGESPNGDGVVTTDPDMDGYVGALVNNGITVSIATDPVYYGAGDVGEKGWNEIATRTGGKMFDIGSAEYDALMISMSKAVNDDVNMKISTIPGNLNIISTVRKQLNALINIMAREVNYIHQSGKTLNGFDGSVFFEPINPEIPIEMGNIKINDLLKDVNYIAASTVDANGDNSLALAIANLRNENLMTGNKKILSLDTYYQNIILDIGNKGHEADNMVNSHTMLVSQSDNIRQTIMGVSLDEEMTNMIKFKYSYNANSKVIDVVNEMIETVIYRMGISGR